MRCTSLYLYRTFDLPWRTVAEKGQQGLSPNVTFCQHILFSWAVPRLLAIPHARARLHPIGTQFYFRAINNLEQENF